MTDTRYEVVHMSNGEVDEVLLQSETPEDVISDFLMRYRRGEMNRIRIDGRILLLCEADEFVNKKALKWSGVPTRRKKARRRVEELDASGKVICVHADVETAASGAGLKLSGLHYRIQAKSGGKDGRYFRYVGQKWRPGEEGER